MSLTLEEILGATEELKTEEVVAPEWSKTRDPKAIVFVRELAGEDADKAVEILAEKDEGGMSLREAWAAWCILCVCAEDHTPLFTLEHKAQLLQGPLPPLRRCAEAAMRINGFGEEAHEEVVGNSDGGQT